MKLQDYCIKQKKQYLLDEWHAKKIFRIPRKQLIIVLASQCGGNARKDTAGKLKSKAVRLPARDVRNVLRKNSPERKTASNLAAF